MAHAIHSDRPDRLDRSNHSSQVQIASGLDLLAAIWLFLSAFFIPGSAWMAWNDIIFSILIGILALCRTFAAFRQSWMSWLNALLGVWVVVSPWLLMRRPADSMVWNNVITGGVIIILSVWSAMATVSGHPTAETESAPARRDEGPPARF